MKILTTIRYSCALILGVLLAFQPVLAATEPAPAGNSRLLGKIQGYEGKPMAGVRVLAYHLSGDDERG